MKLIYILFIYIILLFEFFNIKNNKDLKLKDIIIISIISSSLWCIIIITIIIIDNYLNK